MLRFNWVGFALLLCALAGPAPAQPAPGAPTREQLNPARRAPVLQPQADLFSAPSAGACPLSVDPAPLTVRSVALHGVDAATASALAPAYADLLNRQGDASDLCKIRDRVGDALFRRGILARVEIPVQTIDQGAATIEVIEARIKNVVVRGDPGAAGPAIEAYAQKLRGMTPFDINKAQRYILLASDIPGLKVSATVRPSPSGERGAVDLDLNVTRTAHEEIVNVQNLQAKTTGRWGALGRADFNGYTALGERSSLVAYKTFDNEQWVLQGLEEVRLGGEGLVGRGSLAYGRSNPGDVLAPLNLHSTSVVATAELAYPLLRTRRRNLTLAGGLEAVDQRSKIPGAGRLLDEDLRVLYARLDANATEYLGRRPITLSGEAEVRQGVGGLGASHAGDALLSRAQTDPSALVLRGSGSALTYLTPRLALLVRVEAQHAAHPLSAYEEFSVGDLTIGRGYDPAYVSGDNALAASVELRAGPFQPRAGVLIAPYAFYDAAKVTNHDIGGLDRIVRSAGFGVQVPFTTRYLADLLYAVPIDSRGPGGSKPTPRILVNLTARYF